MESKVCKACGRELPENMFMRTKCGVLMNTCRECRSMAMRETNARKQTQRGGKQTPFSDPDFDGKEPREVIDIMVRCRKWLESRGFEIAMTCVYKEIKIRKIKLE